MLMTYGIKKEAKFEFGTITAVTQLLVVRLYGHYLENLKKRI